MVRYFFQVVNIFKITQMSPDVDVTGPCLQECEHWRGEIIRGVAKKIAEIQNAALGATRAVGWPQGELVTAWDSKLQPVFWRFTMIYHRCDDDFRIGVFTFYWLKFLELMNNTFVYLVILD